MTAWLIANIAPLMFCGLIVTLLLGFPVAYSLGAVGIAFGLLGIELGLLDTSLLQALPEWPGHRYRLKCLVKNRRAKAFYLAHGFRVTGNGTSPEGDYEELSFFPV